MNLYNFFLKFNYKIVLWVKLFHKKMNNLEFFYNI